MNIIKLPEVNSLTLTLRLSATSSLIIQVLCIHLKRFRFDAYFSSKISRHIAFPIHSLDMHSYIKDCEWKYSD